MEFFLALWILALIHEASRATDKLEKVSRSIFKMRQEMDRLDKKVTRLLQNYGLEIEPEPDRQPDRLDVVLESVPKDKTIAVLKVVREVDAISAVMQLESAGARASTAASGLMLDFGS